MPGWSSQVCSWFTSLRPNIKRFWQIGPSAEGRGVSSLIVGQRTGEERARNWRGRARNGGVQGRERRRRKTLVFQGKEIHPKKPATPGNPTENSLCKEFAQTLFVCLLFNLEAGGRTVYTNSSEDFFAQIIFIGVVVSGVDSFP